MVPVVPIALTKCVTSCCVSRYLKEQRREVQILGCQPSDGSSIPGIRRWPKEYLPKIYDASRVDRIVDVTQLDAENSARSMASREGVFVGVSAAGAVWASRLLCRELAAQQRAATVVCILCDRGDRYLSSTLFAS